MFRLVHDHVAIEVLEACEVQGLRVPEQVAEHQLRPELARALATRPKLLLLDEVMAGMRPTEREQLVALLREINRRDGMTILLIEHVMRAVMALAAKGIVLHHGEVISQGTTGQIVRDPAVLECYLGEDSEL